MESGRNNLSQTADNSGARTKKMQCKKGFEDMKATGIVRRIDDLGRVVIPKEIRRTLRIREGDPSLKTLKPWEKSCLTLMELEQRTGLQVIHIDR